MKVIVIYCFVGMVTCINLFGQTKGQIEDMWKNPVQYLQEIMHLIDATPNTEASKRQLTDRMQGLAFAIHADILQAESPDWAHPSPERKSVIEKWGITLEPFVPKLVDLAFSDPDFRSTHATQALSLLDYAAPTEKLGNEVREYLIINEPSRFTNAAKLLMEHRLTTEQDRKIYYEFQKKHNPDDEINIFVSSLYSDNISDQRTKLLSKALHILSQPMPDSTEEQLLLKHYQLVFMVALYGIHNNELRDGLVKLRASATIELKNFLKCINDSLDCIDGKREVFRQEAKNGSGYLLVGAEYYNIQESYPKEVKSFITSPYPLADSRSAAILPEKKKNDKINVPLFISLSIIIFLVIWFLLRWRKSKLYKKMMNI